jgi:hypothetical protein
MSWARYDDELPYNRKVAWLRAHDLEGLSALALHLLANTWSRHEGHQGFIPSYIPEQLVGKQWRKLVALLVEICMFQATENGWMINDYDAYGDRDDGVPVDAKRARLAKIRAEAGRAGGLAKASNRASKQVAELQANGQQSSSPVPVPELLSSYRGNLRTSTRCKMQHPPDAPCGKCRQDRINDEQVAVDVDARKRTSLQRNDQAMSQLDADLSAPRDVRAFTAARAAFETARRPTEVTA